jgi:RND family efflux transporter MFP subunit
MALTVSCGGSEPTPAPAPPSAGVSTPASTEPAAIDVVKVVEQPLAVDLSLPGELRAYQDVAIYSKVTGFVKTITVDRGSAVRQGALLATLEAPELTSERAEAESRVQAAEAQLASAQARAAADAATFDRLKAAAATPGVVAGNDVVTAEKAADASRAQVTAAQRTVEAARQTVNAVRDIEGYLQIRAPFDGVITERHVHPGALVGPSAGAGTPPMLRVVQSDRLRLVVPVPEAYTAEITVGTRIPFAVAAYPAETLTGVLARVSRSVDVATRTMAVELDVDNATGRLAPGGFCQVRWPVRRSSPSLFVPSGSVAATTDRTFVIRVREGRTEWVDIRTGVTSGPLVEVFGALQAGDEIAARGTDELRQGTAVRAQTVGTVSRTS